MSRVTLDLWVGFFVLIGLGALIFLAFRVANLNTFTTGETYRIQGYFDNIGGLKIRAPVKSAGVVIGRVTDVRFDPNSFEAIVTLQISKDYKFPKDTFASILTSGLLGEQYIGLDPGGDSVMLKEGDRIQKTQSAIVLEKLIGQFLFNKATESK